MLKNINGAIFDLDGTLVDSMWVWDKIDVDYLENLGIEKPKNLKEEINHLSFDEVAKYFKDTFNISDSIEDIKKSWMEMAYKEYSENIKLKPGVKSFLEILKKSNIKIALATSNCDELLKVVLQANGILHYFDSITRTDEVTRGKNFPDVYLLAAERLGVSPEKCIVFEDILPAMQAAKSAGMKVIGVEDNYCDTDKADMLEHVDNYISSYDELAV